MEIKRTDDWDAIMARLYKHLDTLRTDVVVKSRKGNPHEIGKSVGAHDAIQDVIKLLEAM